jgi:hypothetical protein
MVSDLLKVRGELCTLPVESSKGEGEGALVLSEDDAMWVEMRHHHIGQVKARTSTHTHTH